MKRLIMATLGVGGLAAVLVRVGLWAMMVSDYSPQRFTGSMRVIRQRINLLTVYKGYVSQEGVFQTDAKVMNVWRWYAQQFDVAPKDGMGLEGQCVSLEKTEQTIFLLRTFGVRLCPVESGTRVFFNQTVYLGR